MEKKECINENSSSLMSKMSKGIHSKRRIDTSMKKWISTVQEKSKIIVRDYIIDWGA